MRIVHIGPLSPHVYGVMRMVNRERPEVQQEWLLPGDATPIKPDLVVLHHAQELHRYANVFLDAGIPVVARTWNLLWAGSEREVEVLHFLRRCAMWIGFGHVPEVAADCPRYRSILPLVDGDHFWPNHGAEPRTRSLFCARLTARDFCNTYWGQELHEALGGVSITYASGYASPAEMGDFMRTTVVVLALGRDPWISSTVVEAALCGAIPVIADTAAHRANFSDSEGNPCGARFCTQDPESIRRAAWEVVDLYHNDRDRWRREVARNLDYFSGWTQQAQGPELVRDMIDCAAAPGARIWTPA